MVSVEQLNSLLDFMKRHPDLAKGLCRGRRGKLMSLEVWASCANTLNAVSDGVVKDGKGWSKYWCDWKYRARRHALEVAAAKESGRPPPDGLTPLSPIEDTIMTIIGENSFEGVVIKSDPLADGDSDEDVPESNGLVNETPDDTGSHETVFKKRKRSNSSRETSDIDNQERPSGPFDKKPKSSDEAEPELDAESSWFYKLEEKKLKVAIAQANSMEIMATQMTRLADIMNRIEEKFAPE